MGNQPLKAIVLGAGMRGSFAYGPYAGQHPDELEFVAVAEPNEIRRQRFATAHDIAPTNIFQTWEDVFKQPKMADVVFNTTQDGMHYASTLAALEAGYDVLLEKPMTNTLEETVHLVQTAEKLGRHLQVCHVLRYTPFFSKLHEIIAAGRLGKVVSVSHLENVRYTHMAHSFVRGNWRNSAESSPMILAKCCHDLDILYWNMGSQVEKIQSFGDLTHFKPENAPADAADRCTDDCPAADNCPFDARRYYLKNDIATVGVLAISEDHSLAGRRKALETGPYGRCVYKCDNDVVDLRTVNMQFAGASVTLFMHGHSFRESRTMRYDGTRASLRGVFYYDDSSFIEIHDHLTDTLETIEIPLAMGHGGGDSGIVRDFIRAVNGDAVAMTTARESLESHIMAFAAEESRLNGTVVDMDKFRQNAEQR